MPHAVTSMARVTGTVPRSGSTFTSTNRAPGASSAYLLRSDEGRESLAHDAILRHGVAVCVRVGDLYDAAR